MSKKNLWERLKEFQLEQPTEPQPAITGLPQGHYVENGQVYESVFGGPNRHVGFVENGLAYETVIGGPPRPLFFCGKR